MTRLSHRLAQRVLAARGLRTRSLTEGLWLLHPQGRRLETRTISPGAWLVRDRRMARRNARRYLHQMAGHLSVEHLAWLLRELEVDCVLDVGANRGQFAKRLRRTGYRGRIVSFEPVSTMFGDLRRKAEGDPDWYVHQIALGERDETATIHVASGAGKTSSLLDASDFGRAQFGSLATEDHAEQIQVRRLDGVYDDAVAGLDAPRVFLKMDTQGFDLATLRGAGERIREVVGLQSEVSCVPIYDGMARMPEQMTEYEAAGFELSGMFPVSFHDATMRAIEFDMLMVRPEAVRR